METIITLERIEFGGRKVIPQHYFKVCPDYINVRIRV